MFIFIIVGLLVFSFLLALFSLWRDLKKNIKTEQVSEELSKGRVVFHAPSIQDMPMHREETQEQPSELSTEHRESVHTEPNISSQPTFDIHSNIPSLQTEASQEPIQSHVPEKETIQANLKSVPTDAHTHSIHTHTVQSPESMKSQEHTSVDPISVSETKSQSIQSEQGDHESTKQEIEETKI